MRRATIAAGLGVLLVAVQPPAASQEPDLPVPGPTIGATPTSPALPAPEASAPRSAEAPCTISGTQGDDRLTGTPAPDVLCGLRGNDVIEGLSGDDVLDGGEGVDTATWETSACCVAADLQAGTAGGSAGNDQLISIESLTGSQGGDVLRGNAEANVLTGLGATDLLYGRDGNDVLLGGDGDDWLAGEAGTNGLDGGEGADICADGAGLSCEPPVVADESGGRGLDVRLVAPAAGPTFTIEVAGGTSARRLWDKGYLVVSLDTRGGDEIDMHALVRWTSRRPRGVLLGDRARQGSGPLRARRAGKRGVIVEAPAAKIGADLARPYVRWSVQSIFTGPGCRPCFDALPAEGAFPLPLV